jgi:hypothetical protein
MFEKLSRFWKRNIEPLGAFLLLAVFILGAFIYISVSNSWHVYKGDQRFKVSFPTKDYGVQDATDESLKTYGVNAAASADVPEDLKPVNNNGQAPNWEEINSTERHTVEGHVENSYYDFQVLTYPQTYSRVSEQFEARVQREAQGNKLITTNSAQYRGYPQRDLVIEKPGGLRKWFRVILVGNTQYLMSAEQTPAGVSGVTTDLVPHWEKFFNSFHLRQK